LTLGSDGGDRLQGIEYIQFADQTVSVNTVPAFDTYEYIASNPDLITAFGANAEASFDHYIDHGFAEGRSLNLFDGLEYLASNPDLITAFGANAEAGAHHYDSNGYNEGRATTSFDALEYLASNPDLITAFGANAEAGAQHYDAYGFNEGRATTSFNAEQYLANYRDLQAAFGDDPKAATFHFDSNGYNEGRKAQALPGSTLGVFVGNANANTMVVGAGDTMTGGGGADTFVFKALPSTPATITDFTHGTDILQISASGFGHGLVAGGTAPLVTAADIALASHAGTNGYFILDNSGANAGTLYWDATGGSGADATPVVHLQNVTALLSSDFHLV